MELDSATNSNIARVAPSVTAVVPGGVRRRVCVLCVEAEFELRSRHPSYCRGVNNLVGAQAMHERCHLAPCHESVWAVVCAVPASLGHAGRGEPLDIVECPICRRYISEGLADRNRPNWNEQQHERSYNDQYSTRCSVHDLLSYNDFQQPYFTVVINDGIITAPDQKVIEWNTNRTRTWLAGEDTYLNVLDDEYELAGSAVGVTSRDVAFTFTITKPLNVKGDCRWVRSGTIDLKVNNTLIVTTDYGDSDCSPNATATILGKTFPFIMK